MPIVLIVAGSGITPLLAMAKAHLARGADAAPLRLIHCVPNGESHPLRGEIDALAAYVQTYGGGPKSPEKTGEALRGDDPARGGELFRLNCASCHNFTGQGGALSSGKFAPPLEPANEKQLYAAMSTGPSNMPKFSDRQLTPEEKKDIIAYVKSVTAGDNSPGGFSLGGFGPASEGVVAWVVGIGALIGATLWIGSKA